MNDKQMLEQAIENAKDIVRELEGQHRELYGYNDEDLECILQYIKDSEHLGLTEYEIKRKNSSYADMSKKNIIKALGELISCGDIEVLSTTHKFGGGRPRVAYVAKEFANT